MAPESPDNAERHVLTSERQYMQEVWVDAQIARDGLQEETTVAELDLDERHPNPLAEEAIGQYLPSARRKLATADEEIVSALAERGLSPSFLEAGPREFLRLDPCRVRAAVVAVGGTAPGTNAVIHAIVRRHTRYVEAAGRAWGTGASGPGPVYLGILNGFEGLMAPRPWPAAAVPGPLELSLEVTQPWRDQAGCQLGLSRYDFSVPGRVEQAARNLIEEGIDIVYVIGGDGGMEASLRLWGALRRDPQGRNIVVAGIPKTMDNDIAWSWYSLGHRTALAEAARILNVLRTDAEANRRVILVELFGADAGFVTASAVLASGKADCVLIREEPFDPWRLVGYIAQRTRERNCALVVIAEGALLDLGTRLRREGVLAPPARALAALQDPWYERRDLRDLALKWIRDELRREFVKPEVFTGHVVVNQPGYLIRAVPPSAEDMVYAERLGDLAVDSALAGYTGFMTTQWLNQYVLVPLPLVVRVRRRVPRGGIFWREVVASTGQPALG